MLTSSPGSGSANSYVSEQEFADYLDQRINAPDPSDPGDLARALIMATQRIDEEDFRGVPSKPLNGTGYPMTQALKWPRFGARNDDGHAYASDAVPELVKRATMELAVRILNDGEEDFLSEGELEAFEEIRIDVISLTPRHGRAGGRLPDNVVRILRPVLTTPRGMTRLRRG